MSISKKLKDKIQSYYLEENFSDYELEELSTSLVDFFCLGSKIVSRYKKN